jgi:hypothetical protein
MEWLKMSWYVKVKKFESIEMKCSLRLIKSQYANTIKDFFMKKTTGFPEGTFILRTSHPPVNLTAYLL